MDGLNGRCTQAAGRHTDRQTCRQMLMGRMHHHNVITRSHSSFSICVRAYRVRQCAVHDPKAIYFLNIYLSDADETIIYNRVIILSQSISIVSISIDNCLDEPRRAEI